MKREYHLVNGRSISLERGDITKVETDAIVNAANRRMLGGGGVDGAIHLWAGPELEAACRIFPEIEPDIRCPTGEARITPGFQLSARFVIHAVGPIFESLEVSGPILEQTYRSALRLAEENSVRSLAFPAISCGIFCFPMHEAAEIALSTCREHTGALNDIRFILFSITDYEVWLSVADTQMRGP